MGWSRPVHYHQKNGHQTVLDSQTGISELDLGLCVNVAPRTLPPNCQFPILTSSALNAILQAQSESILSGILKILIPDHHHLTFFFSLVP
jgi:hypothetical protein